MSKPIFDPKFWEGRLADAERVGVDHLAVFNVPSMMDIDRTHSAILRKEIQPTDFVLDAGCGYGRTAYLFNPLNYTGVDFLQAFVDKAKKRTPSHLFLQADLRKLPFKDGQFDVAFCISMKQMVISNAGESVWEEMAKELKRVAKRVLILEYSKPETYERL